MNPGAGSGFDRIKSPDSWARREAGADADPQGRAALFTGADEAVRAATAGPPDGFHVSCSRCGATTGIDTKTAVRLAAPLFLLAPWKSHPVFAVCPSCGVRSWVRVRL